MTEKTDFYSVFLSDPRLAAHALSPAPVWLWSADATCILWANPTAAAIFDAGSPAAVTALRFDPTHPAATQIARISGTLADGGAPRFERLRGFGASLGGVLVCLCSRITLGSNMTGILVVSTERAGKDLTLPDRAERLLSDLPGAAALFSADGELVAATSKARVCMGQHRDLTALDAETIARAATLDGQAEGTISAGRIEMLKLGAGATFLLLATFIDTAATASAPEEAAARTPVPRPPLRFVWQMDAAFCFTDGLTDFARLLGPKTAALLDRPWPQIAEQLNLDPTGQVASALASHETWSGIVVNWPTDEEEFLRIEMSGLPTFGRDRQFTGYRGFGICRDREQVDTLQLRRTETVRAPSEPKVVPFPATPAEAQRPPDAEPTPMLSPGENSAFQELARALNERLKKAPAETRSRAPAEPIRSEPAFAPTPAPSQPPQLGRNADAMGATRDGRPILDRLPVGILIYRLNSLIYANTAFLEWAGYPSLQALGEAGGLDSLFIEATDLSLPDSARRTGEGPRALTIATVNSNQKPVAGELFSLTWNDEAALALMIDTQVRTDGDQAGAAEATVLRLEAENHELKTILDTATDGVLVLDRNGRIVSANRSAEVLFGYDAGALTDLTLGDLFAPESGRGVLDDFARLAHARGAATLDAGREAIGRVRGGGLVPLSITIGRIEDGDKLCAVLRDITAWKHSEEELTHARQEAEKFATAKSDLLAKISHEVRMPLNAIIGFSEVMMEQRFGAIDNERYRQYLQDIHAAGSQLIAFIDDLVDLAKIEAGKFDLSFVSVNLNDLTQQCVAVLQPEANRARVIIRTALAVSLPPIVADARSLRQIVLNILSNSIKFSTAGGQVIVSTALSEAHEVVLHVRDTSRGMSEKELETALEPFRQIGIAARRAASGSGLALPITKALAAANHARFAITCQANDGTLVELTFPATRVLAP